jgi:succinate-semialdehyde dehydrogenase/glutarate-semialdehyde dehydrogenase
MFIDVDQIEPIVADIRLGGVQFTGSTRAGKSIGALAGKHLKRVCLELGGSDPFVVLDDVDAVMVKLQTLTF